jgi:type II secretion system protein N
MKRPSFKTILICLALFNFFLVWRFPYRNLRGTVFEQIYKNTGIRVESHDFYPVFLGWPGLRFSKASVIIPVNRTQTVDFSSERITARAGIGGIFPPSPSISLYIEGLAKGGDVFAKISPSRNQISGNASLTKVKLDQFALPWFPEPLSGELTATGSFYFPGTDFAKSDLQFNIASDKLIIPGQSMQGIILPRVEFQKVDGKITTKDGAILIEKFQFGSADSDLKGNISGSLKLGPTFGKSFLSLLLRLQLSETYKTDPNSATLVSFLSTFQTGNSGEYALKWAAVLDDMQRNLILAIPQRP